MHKRHGCKWRLLTATLLEVGSKCNFLYWKSPAACRAKVVNDPSPQPEASRQQCGAAWGAHRCANVKIGEPHPAGREFIEVGRVFWLRELWIPRTGVSRPIRSHVSVTPVIPIAGDEIMRLGQLTGAPPRGGDRKCTLHAHPKRIKKLGRAGRRAAALAAPMMAAANRTHRLPLIEMAQEPKRSSALKRAPRHRRTRPSQLRA